MIALSSSACGGLLPDLPDAGGGDSSPDEGSKDEPEGGETGTTGSGTEAPEGTGSGTEDGPEGSTGSAEEEDSSSPTEDTETDTTKPEPEESTEPEPEESTEPAPEESTEPSPETTEEDPSKDTPKPKKLGSGEKCKKDSECESDTCRKVSLEYLSFKWSTKTCAECDEHKDCTDPEKGLSCSPIPPSIKGRDRTYYGCTDGKLGDICDKSDHCEGDLRCARPIHGIPLLPKFPIKVCSECKTDKDCKDDDRPKCKLNRSVDALKLPAYNRCVAK